MWCFSRSLFLNGMDAASADANFVERQRRTEARISTLTRVLPLGLVQFADYLTDLLVLFQFFETGHHRHAWIGVSFLIASILFSWIGAFLLNLKTARGRESVIVLLLAPLNLHTLYLGWLSSISMAKQEEIKTQGREDCLPAIRQYEAAERAIVSARAKGDRNGEVAAKHKKALARSYIPYLQEESAYCVILLFVFTASKGLESAFESFPMSVLTTAHILSGEHSRGTLTILWSSLTLSMLSMSYGFFSTAIRLRRESEWAEGPDLTSGREFLLFLATLSNVTWAVVALSLCLASPELYPANYSLPLAAILLVWVLVILPSTLYSEFVIRERTLRDFLWAATASVWLFMISVVGAAVDACNLFEPVLRENLGDYIKSMGISTFALRVMPCLRRLLLTGMAGAALAASTHSPLTTVVVVVTWLLDAAAGLYWITVTRLQGPSVQDLEHADNAASIAPQLDVADTREDRELQVFESEVQAPKEVHCLDLIQAMRKHVDEGLVNVTACLQPPADVEALLQSLRRRLAELEEHLGRDVLGPTDIDAIICAIDCYTPSQSGSTDMLQTALQRLETFSSNLNHGLRVEPSPYAHPMHAVLLQHGLVRSTWTNVPSFFGTSSSGTAFELSFQADSCDFFVSHAWSDDGHKKVTMLREFLCLQGLLGQAFIVFPLVAAFTIPPGFAAEHMFSIAWWILPCVPLALFGILLLWVLFSAAGLLPCRAAPWAFMSTTIWIDKLCINQESDQTKAAGVASFPVVLKQSSRMVAFVSERYLTRLWCVYELAMFTKDKPPEALLLLSLDWPSSLHPWKSSQLSDLEQALLANFSCKDAACFRPRDRATVLQAIRHRFGSEDAFDDYVRTQLPAVLAHSKQEYCRRLSAVALSSLSMVFGG